MGLVQQIARIIQTVELFPKGILDNGFLREDQAIEVAQAIIDEMSMKPEECPNCKHEHICGYCPNCGETW